MKLAFWTDRDTGRIDALFRRSGRCAKSGSAPITARPPSAKPSSKPTRRGSPPPWRRALVDLNQCQPSLELLNAQPIFGGRIQFSSVRRRGPMIIATPTQGQEIVWYSIADLTSFSRSQGILADATHV